MDFEHFRGLLLARRAALLADADGDAAATVELDQTRQGRLSRMDAMQQQAMAAATGQRRTTELARIDAALARIDSGDYGLCLGCDEEIAPARLEIDPAATRCISCAAKAES
ncbi:MAG: TraR/DksA family transcriptional regulator [Gammaproteobacteria bacterium]|jgi:DnaK suppressor protein|nr:TraR/DksA family transcriptional regulator [Gammaproteobacteria bacterium]